jgi:hypothetical protein
MQTRNIGDDNTGESDAFGRNVLIILFPIPGRSCEIQF